jgi:hypothetical protein
MKRISVDGKPINKSDFNEKQTAISRKRREGLPQRSK